MKRKYIFLLSACLLVVLQLNGQILSDDFNAGTLDSGKWQVLAPLSDSRMTASGGNAVFFQRGILISQQELPTAIDIRGRFAFTGGTYDLFDINLRTDGSSDSAYANFTNNIYVGFHFRGGDNGNQTGQNNVMIQGGLKTLGVTTSFTFVQNTFYDFRILDDGNSITVYLGDLKTPILSVATTEKTGNRIALENRAFVPWWPTYDNQVSLDYIEIAHIAKPEIRIDGPGSISSYEPKSYELGKRYILTAKPADGCAFMGWSGSISSLRRKLSFVMETNLMFTAYFRDIRKPIAVTTYPKQNREVDGRTVIAGGNAKDNVGVSAVWYRFNDGDWKLANSGNSWTNWQTENLQLLLGINQIGTYVVDLGGNVSRTNLLRFKCAPSAPWSGTWTGIVEDGNSLVKITMYLNQVSSTTVVGAVIQSKSDGDIRVTSIASSVIKDGLLYISDFFGGGYTISFGWNTLQGVQSNGYYSGLFELQYVGPYLSPFAR